MKQIIIVFAAMLVLSLDAQVWSYSPEPEYLGLHKASSIAQTATLELIWAGEITDGLAANGSPSVDRQVVYHESDGAVRWERVWNDTICCESSTAVAVLNNGNVVTVGREWIPNGSLTGYVAVLDELNGSILFEEVLDYTVVNVFATADGFLIAGAIGGFLRLDYRSNTGEQLASYTIAEPTTVRQIERNSDGEIYVLFNNKLLKLDADGNELFAINHPQFFFAAGLAATSDGGAIIQGQNGDDGSDFYFYHEIIKYDAQGDLEWVNHPSECFADGFQQIYEVAGGYWSVGNYCFNGSADFQNQAIFRLTSAGTMTGNPVSTIGLAVEDLHYDAGLVAVAGYHRNSNTPGWDERSYVSRGTTTEIFQCNLSLENTGFTQFGNDPITLQVYSQYGAGTYLFDWEDHPGLSSTTAQWPTITVTENTVLQLTVTDSNGCSIEEEISISYPVEGQTVLIPNCGEELVLEGVDFFAGGEEVTWTLNGVPQTTEQLTVPIPAAGGESPLSVMANGLSQEIIVQNQGDCVWPGDANYDGVANNSDLLTIAEAFGLQDIARFREGIEWKDYGAYPWQMSFGEDPINAKHVDCNGDGIVDEQDIIAIANNYDETHGKDSGNLIGTNTISLGAPEFGGYHQLCFPILVNEETEEVISMQGIALSLDYTNSDLPQWWSPSHTYVTWDPESWLLEGNDFIEIQHHFEDNRLDVAVSRTDQQAKAGTGVIGHWCVWQDEFMADDAHQLHIASVDAVTDNLAPVFFEIADPFPSGINLAAETSFSAYPNPSSDWLFIDSVNELPLGEVQIWNILGHLVYQAESSGSTLKIKVDDFPSGSYIVQSGKERVAIVLTK